MILRYTGTLVILGGVVVAVATGNLVAELLLIGIGVVLVWRGGRRGRR